MLPALHEEITECEVSLESEPVAFHPEIPLVLQNSRVDAVGIIPLGKILRVLPDNVILSIRPAKLPDLGKDGYGGFHCSFRTCEE